VSILSNPKEVMTLYVDEILMASDSLEMIIATMSWLTLNFNMKNMGDASYMFKVKIYKNRFKRILGHSQEMYLKNILAGFKMHN